MKRFATALCALLLPICGFAADYITNAGDIVKAADWDKMVTVTVEMEEFAYEPGDLVFKAGQPYKLVLKNSGEKKHYFTAPGFYKAIATRKVQSNKDGEIKAPYFTAIELMVGGQLDLYFVPVTKGEFPVYCTIDDHREQGMEGSLTIR
ncbi:MAG: hypothetical protein DRR03_02675 [Gammaproteobacteria bacterium]|nr:MAG: hypothetical protein DRR03_02675 [Gammaproteobacteria bacterium]